MRKQVLPQLITLPGGLRLVHRLDRGASVDYCGVIVGVGSRDDGDDHFGIAHFVEHTIFKGTLRRSSWHILNRMERIGGELNAYTTKEHTVVYCAAPAGNHLRGLELIADLVCNSQFPERELEKEREVVLDEMDSYLDSPADAVLDDFEDLIFHDTPLGHNILGNRECLNRFSSDFCKEYLKKWYTTCNIVVFYCGPASLERIAKAVEKYFACLPSHPVPQRLPLNLRPTRFEEKRVTNIHQANVAMGAIAPSMMSDERFAFSLLNNIIGGPGMNSLLNLDLREHRGLVYAIDSTVALLSDTGLLCIYFGCDPEDADCCRRLVVERLQDLASAPMTCRFVESAKKQYIGQMTVAADNRESTIISAAGSALRYGQIFTPGHFIDNIRAVTPEMLRAAAETIAHPSILTFAP